MSIIYDGSLYYESKHLPPWYDKRGYHLHTINISIFISKNNSIIYDMVALGKGIFYWRDVCDILV